MRSIITALLVSVALIGCSPGGECIHRSRDSGVSGDSSPDSGEVSPEDCDMMRSAYKDSMYRMDCAWDFPRCGSEHSPEECILAFTYAQNCDQLYSAASACSL